MPGTARTIGWGGVLGQISWLCGVNVKSTKDGKLTRMGHSRENGQGNKPHQFSCMHVFQADNADTRIAGDWVQGWRHEMLAVLRQP
jgi:hypothetical protein